MTRFGINESDSGTCKMTKKRAITAEEFDRLFDEGSDEIDKYIDWESARRPLSRYLTDANVSEGRREKVHMRAEDFYEQSKGAYFGNT